MNKKLRLLVTAKCHNKCPMCCNNQFDFEKIPVVDRLDYDEISITGGEPAAAGLQRKDNMACTRNQKRVPYAWNPCTETFPLYGMG